MAVELCSENCYGVSSSSISPRISFSHDFSQSDFIPVEQQQQNPLGSEPSSSSDHNLNQNTDNDFDFCVTESFDLESFPAADEFFSDGRILPTEIKTSSQNNNNSIILKQKGHQLLAPPQQHPPPLPPSPCVNNNHHHHHHHNSKNLKKESYKEGKCLNNDEVCDSKQSSNSSNSKSSFWSFRRSSSCGNGYRRSSLCPLPLLSRSNSTGSTSPEYFKRNSLSKEGSISNSSKHHQNPQKHSSSSSSSSSRCSSPSLGPNIYQKPPLNYNKIHHGSYGNNSVRVSPALNVHSANLFGLGSIFNNKDKGKKK